MAESRELLVKVRGDASGFESSMKNAADAADKLEHDLQDLDDIEISPELKLDRLNRDRRQLNQVLAGIETRKANPQVGLNMTKLLAEEQRVRRQLALLDAQKVEIEVELDTHGTAVDLTRLSTVIGHLDGFVPGVNLLTGALGKLKPLLGPVGIPAAIAASVVAIDLGIVALGKMAAEAETTRVALSTLADVDISVGTALFEELTDFADKTPFQLDEVTGAAKRLLAVGEPLASLPETLASLGDVAAAAGIPLDELTTIYAQMTAKGKITAEDMNQLSERGINAWGTLSKATGKSVAELQKLGTQGKLTQEDIDLLWSTLQEDFSGSVIRQADTLNGKLSSLSDSASRVGREIGEMFLEPAKDVVDSTNSIVGGIGDIIDAAGGLNEALFPGDKSLLEAAFDVSGIGMITQGLGWLGDGMSWLADQANNLTGNNNTLNDSIGTSGLVLNEAGDGYTYVGDVISVVADEVEALSYAVDILNGSFIESERAGERAADTSKRFADEAKKSGKITGDTAVALIDTTEAHLKHIDAMIADGASLKDITKVNDGWYDSLIDSAAAAGISKDEVDDYLKQLGYIPKDVETLITANTLDADDDVADLKKQIAGLPDGVDIPISVRFKIANPGVYAKIERLQAGNVMVPITGIPIVTPFGTATATIPGMGREQGASVSYTYNYEITVPGAGDPGLVAREVDRYIRRSGSPGRVSVTA